MAALMPPWASDNQPNAAQAAAGELAQKRRPERLGFGGTNTYAENFVPGRHC